MMMIITKKIIFKKNEITRYDKDSKQMIISRTITLFMHFFPMMNKI